MISAAPPVRRNNGIQALRGVACFLVIFQHVTYYVCYAKGLDYKPYLPIDFGQIGVGLFFVISGFVMGQCLDQGPRFLLNRIIRIYPPFWIAIGFSFLLLTRSVPDWHIDWWSTFLVPSLIPNNSLRIPYWTLCYEMAFYVATYTAILCRLSRPHVAICCLVWMALICLLDSYRLTGLFPAPDRFLPGWWILFAPISILFAMGLFVSTADRRISDLIPTAYLFLFSLGLGYLGLKLSMDTPAPSYILMGSAFSALVIAATRSHLPWPFRAIGDYSYGIYLVHMMIIAAMLEALQPYAAIMRLSYLWGAVGVASLAGGILFGWLEFEIHSRFLAKALGRRDHGRSPRGGP